jgi:hypothetical protein
LSLFPEDDKIAPTTRMKADEFEVDPETQAEIDFLFECAFETEKANRVKFDEEVLHLLSISRILFGKNIIEVDFRPGLMGSGWTVVTRIIFP